MMNTYHQSKPVSVIPTFYRSPMKKLSSLFALALCAQLASAAPYVVYSGQAQGSVTSAAGPVKETTDIYLVTDLSDTSSYGILRYDAKTKQGAITIYPIASPTDVESNLNFFGNVATTSGKRSLAVLSIGDILTDSSNNSNITHAYATGTMTAEKIRLVNARQKLTFVTKSSGKVTGTVTFPASAAITNAGLPYPPVLNGLTLAYTIAPSGSLTQASGNGNLGLSLDYTFTPAANIVGEFTSGRNVTTLEPISTANSTVLVAYDNFLANLASALGVILPTNNAGSGDGGDGGAVITVGGGGTGIIDGGGYTGTITLGGGTIIVSGGANPNGGSGTLTLNGGGSNDGGDGGGTGTFTLGGGTITTGTGSLTLNGGTGTSTLTGNLILSSGTVAITAVNGSLYSGTIVTAAPNSITIGFSNVALVLNGTANPTGVAAGDSYTSSASLSGGSYTLTSSAPPVPGTYTSGTLTITTP